MSRLDREERSVWRAAYAAAFAMSAHHRDAHPVHDPVHAVQAIEVADRAVKALRDRRATGDARAGKSLW
jgi:hypothetical protein